MKFQISNFKFQINSTVSSPAVAILYALMTLVLFVPACQKKPKQQPPKAVPVAAAEAIRKDVPVQLTAIGNVEAYSTVAVNSRVAGQIQRVHFREGQDVNKGYLLFTIDPRPFEAALRQAEGTLAKDTAQMENAKLQARRYEELVKKGYVAQADYDQFRTAASSFEAIVRADKAAVENARLQLSYCYIHAPISGRTGNLQVNEGNIIKENDKTIVTINKIQPIYIGFSLPEQSLPEVKKHAAGGRLKVIAAIAQEEDRPEEGTLTFIDNAVDRATGTIRLKGTFENKNKRLWPGQFVNVTLKLAVQPDAIIVPSQAVQTGQQGQYVFVIKSDSSVEMRTVAVSRTLGNESVVDKGLNPGERVVTDGQLRLTPGAKVEVKTASGTVK